MLAFSIDYYGMIFRATQSVELFCTYEDVNEKLYVLSTYLGHVKPADTFWYLSATPELLTVSCSKYEEQFGGDDDEI